MELKAAIDAFVQILNTSITIYGYSFSLLQVVLFIGFASICCFAIGGIFK